MRLATLFLALVVVADASAAQLSLPTYITEDRPVPSRQIVLAAEALDGAVWFVWTDAALKSGVSVARQPIPLDEQSVITTAPVDAVAATFPLLAWIQNGDVFATLVDRDGKPIGDLIHFGNYPGATDIAVTQTFAHFSIVWNSGSKLIHADVDGNGHVVGTPVIDDVGRAVRRVGIASNGTNILTVWEADGHIYANGVEVANGRDPFIASNGFEYLLAWSDAGVHLQRFGVDGSRNGNPIVLTDEGETPRVVWDGSGWDVGYLTPLLYHGIPQSEALSIVRVDRNLVTVETLTPFAIANVFNFCLAARNAEVVVARQEYWIEAQYAPVDPPAIRRRPSH